jgi:predicted ABC-type ATPase
VGAWRALLGVCIIHGNVEIGEDIVKRNFELSLEIVTSYVMLSNIYVVANNNRHLCENVERQKKEGKRCEETIGLHLD